MLSGQQLVERENKARRVDAEITYLDSGNVINRRFVCAGAEVNTGTYSPHAVEVRDGRSLSTDITLDKQGFMLARHVSAVPNFLDRSAVTATYPQEAAEVVKRLTGADVVVPGGWMIRTQGEQLKVKKIAGYQHAGGVQPPAGECHVDFAPDVAERQAAKYYAQNFPDGPPYQRFIATSFWRCFSGGAQDWPLALCDARSVEMDEGYKNTLVVVDEIPAREELFAPIDAEDKMIAATIFEYNENHRWWYFSNMQPDEVLLFKFYDSDSSVAQRVPHSAFYDAGADNPIPRQSIEFRSIAYFY